MIMIGSMELSRTVDEDRFYCPTCGTAQAGEIRRKRPFLTLYFIPVVPIGAGEERLRCRQCRQTFDVSLRTIDEATFRRRRRGEFVDAVLRSAALMMVGGADRPADAIERLEDIRRQLENPNTQRDDLEASDPRTIYEAARVTRTDPLSYVADVSQVWTIVERGEALRWMYRAVASDVEPTDRQIGDLVLMKDILDMTDAEFRGHIVAAA